MSRTLIYCLALIAVAGCSDSPPSQKGEAPPVAAERPLQPTIPPTAESSPRKPELGGAKTVAEVRAELQSRIDHVLGGQPFDKAFPYAGSALYGMAISGKIAGIEIIRVVQKYDKDGNAVPNAFVSVISFTVDDAVSGKRETREFECSDFVFYKGEWDFYQWRAEP